MSYPKTRAVASMSRRQRGVTLIELMISVVLAMVLMAGAIQVFIANRTTYAFNEGLSRLQENARFALDYIANDVRMTGYVGCLANLGVNNNLNAPDAFRDDLENGLQGYEYVTGAAFAATAIDPAAETNESLWEPDLPAQLANVVIPGSDVLVVRRLGSRSSALISPFSDLDKIYPEDATLFQQGQVVVASDCQKATVFQVTNADPAMSGTLEHVTGGYTPGNSIAAWPTEQLYGLGSEVAALETVVFFVGRGGNGSPALFQSRLRRDPVDPTLTEFGAPEEIVDSIDTMQVRYGWDSDNNNAIDQWLRADEVDAAKWDEIRSVEVSLLARATEEYGTAVDAATYPLGGLTFDPVDDRRLRRVFSTVIGLRNRLP
jgi:type IV pilus assembly protein PilW